MRLDPKATALLLMDFQASILSTLPTPDDVVSKAAAAGAALRGAGGQVAYVRVGYTPAELDGFPPHSAMGHRMKAVGSAVMADAPSTQVDARIAPHADDVVVLKRRVGPFSTTDLHARLKAAAVETLVLAGVHTSGCVLTAVREAFDLDYQILVLSDGCADPDGSTHDFLTRVVFPKQAKVMTTAEFVAGLAAGAD